MKIQIQFKDPDGVSESIRQFTEAQAAGIEGIDDDEREQLIESKTDKAAKAIGPWVKYGEYITVEIDTDKGTATVLKVK